ncbi:hypothetical protein L208DRAFT_1399451 [Tricholoma matsutake]|nr:hypothetical protein L208DRAFT_1399451 [Tricholoma matsutake 945]
MAASFAAYASQFLARQQNGGAASMASSQPLFFSFTTDDGSRAGHELDTDIDDLDDPHLRDSGRSTTKGYNHGDEDEDPYLRLDEDERTGRMGYDSRHHGQSIPLIASDHGSLSPEPPKGWLAHLASPMMHQSRMPTRSRSPSPSASTDSASPPNFFNANPETIRVQPPPLPPPPPTSREPVSLSLTESLLPRDGLTRPLDVFSLPDPRHTPRRRRKYHNSIWTAIWCTGVSVCVFFSILLLFLTKKPTSSPVTLPYTTLLHTVPILTILTFLSAFVAYSHILLLRIFVRPVMIATSVFIPATLFVSAVWAFAGSFMWDADVEPTWGETLGLRFFSIIPLVLCLLTARRLIDLPRQVHTTSATLTLSTQLLVANPFLLALSPTILLAALLASIPFLTLIFRLLLMGQPHKASPVWEWHVYGWANWSIAGTVAVWLWTWGVARGILRMTASSVIGAWYFADPDASPPSPTSTHTIHAAITRSTGPNLGTIVLSALLLTLVHLLSLLTLFLHRLPMYIPARAFFLVSGIRFAVGYLEAGTTALSKYALVYAGLTGDPFMGSARRARALTVGAETRVGRRRGYSAEPPLTLLTIAPLTMTFPFALTTYLFVAHTLGVPQQALGASILAGGVTALVGLFCVGLVKDTADTLYMCYCIDKGMGERRREEVFVVFEYDRQARQTQGLQPQSTQQEPPHRQQHPARAPQRHTTYTEPRQPHPRHQQHPQAPPQVPPASQSYKPSMSISRQPLSPPSPPPPPPLPSLSVSPPTAKASTVLEEDGDVDPFLEDRPVRRSDEVEVNVKDRNESGSEDEDEGPADGSQFFPGSGFF